MDRKIRRQTRHPFRRAQQNPVPSAVGWLLVALTACAGSDGSSDEAPMPHADQAQQTAGTAGAANDPCALVTSAEAEQLLAAPVETQRPREANNEYLATCRYVASRGEGVAVLVVTVSRKNGPIGYENAKRMEEAGIAIQPVSGVGDDAFWVGDPLHTLYVLQDTTYLDIGFLDIGGDGQLEQVRPLALTAVQRLR